MNDDDYMRLALEEARRAQAAGNRPVAAVLVRDGEILALGRNSVAADCDPSAHAEVAAIRTACQHARAIDLSGATLYSTLEPCPMCLWVTLEARVSRLVIGARHAELKRADTGDYSVETFLALTRRPLAFTSGVLGRECLDLRLAWMRAQAAANKV